MSLGSGSQGNATVVCSQQAALMVDCGFSVREVCRRLEQADIQPQALDAILVTHEHGDHIRGVGAFAKRFGVPVYASSGTAQHFRDVPVDIELINVHKPFSIKDMQIFPVPVPHDAREPCQFVFSTDRYRFGMLTDTGSITPHIIQSYTDCDAVLLEFNHDTDMLACSNYPVSVQQRIKGQLGHLSNEQSCELLDQLIQTSLRFLLAGHLSESNNSRDQVHAKITAAMNGHNCSFDIASQNKISGWYSLEKLC